MTLKCAEKYRYYRLNVRFERETQSKHVCGGERRRERKTEEERQQVTGSFELDPLAWRRFCSKRLAMQRRQLHFSLSPSLSPFLFLASSCSCACNYAALINVVYKQKFYKVRNVDEWKKNNSRRQDEPIGNSWSDRRAFAQWSHRHESSVSVCGGELLRSTPTKCRKSKLVLVWKLTHRQRASTKRSINK